jgi:hypothetical protein
MTIEYKNILIHPADNGGCGYYRLLQPGKTLAAHRSINVFKNDRESLDEATLREYYPDITNVVLQRIMHPQALKAVQEYKRMGLKVAIDHDDLLWKVPTTNPFNKNFKIENYRALKQSLIDCDKVIVSTEPLKREIYRLAKNKPVVVLPNMINRCLYSPKPSTRGEKLRVGWAGSVTHKADLSQIEYVVKSTLDRYQWVFVWYCPPSLKPYVEFHEGVPINEEHSAIALEYGTVQTSQMHHERLQALKLDLAIAPLEINRFNECKSHIKLLEYSSISVPTIASNVYPYYENPNHNITPSKRQHKEWLDLLEMYDTDETLRLEHAKKAFDWALKYTLEHNVDLIEQAWFN